MSVDICILSASYILASQEFCDFLKNFVMTYAYLVKECLTVILAGFDLHLLLAECQ